MIQCDIWATEKDVAASSQFFFTVHILMSSKSGLKLSSCEIECLLWKYRACFVIVVENVRYYATKYSIMPEIQIAQRM